MYTTSTKHKPKKPLKGALEKISRTLQSQQRTVRHRFPRRATFTSVSSICHNPNPPLLPGRGASITHSSTAATEQRDNVIGYEYFDYNQKVNPDRTLLFCLTPKHIRGFIQEWQLSCCCYRYRCVHSFLSFLLYQVAAFRRC